MVAHEGRTRSVRYAVRFGLGVAMVGMCGCVTVARSPDAVAATPSPPVPAPHFQAAPPTPTPPAALPAAAEAPPTSPTPPGPVALTAEDSAALRIAVTATGDGDAVTVASALRTHVEGELARDGFAVYPKDQDLNVRLVVSTERFDQSGDYEVHMGRAEVEVVRACDGRVIGKTTIEGRGERQLGRTAALGALGAKLQAQTAEWLAATVRPEKAGLACARLRVRRAGGDRATDGAYAAEFARKVGSVKGIVGCTLETADYEARRLYYRVVYFRDVLPEGLTACLSAARELGVSPDVGPK